MKEGLSLPSYLGFHWLVWWWWFSSWSDSCNSKNRTNPSCFKQGWSLLLEQFPHLLRLKERQNQGELWVICSFPSPKFVLKPQRIFMERVRQYRTVVSKSEHPSQNQLRSLLKMQTLDQLSWSFVGEALESTCLTSFPGILGHRYWRT